MANKEIHYMSDNGTMFWPATTTTAIIDPTSREILSDILNKKVSVGVAGNIPATVLPPIILNSISINSTNLTLDSSSVGNVYYLPDTKKIRYVYSITDQTPTSEDTDPSSELIYYDKATDKFYRWDATTQGMVNIVAETSTDEPTFLNIDLADLESETVSTFLTEYYPSSEEDPLSSSTFEDSEGKYKNIIFRIRVLEEDNPEEMASEDIDEDYWNFSIKLTPLTSETADNAWNSYSNFLFGSYIYSGTTYSVIISKIDNTGYTYYIQKFKLENLGIITSLSAYEDVPVYPTAGDDINIAFGKINRIVQSHEEVTARALLDLNSRMGGMQEILYSDLVALKTAGNLVPGRLYRITDYTCTTTQTDTQSAGHLFDIIVFALSETRLSEIAWAEHHSGDTYFSNCNLVAWELKYCLDNDTSRFSWADTTNGKGVIYWMKDEWGNECPYDFKNIQFKRYQLSSLSSWSYNGPMTEETFRFSPTNPYYYRTSSGTTEGAPYRAQVGDSSYFYTFNGIEITNALTAASESEYIFENYDMSFQKTRGTYAEVCKFNKIENYFFTYLPNVVFFGYPNGEGNEEGIYSAQFITDVFGNEISLSCTNLTFGPNAQDNHVNCFSSNVVFGKDCWQNEVGQGCSIIVFGNKCGRNVIGDNGSYINISGQGTDDNNETYINQCIDNYIENSGMEIYLSGSNNTIHSNCQKLAMYGESQGNTIESNFSVGTIYNSNHCCIGESCDHISFGKASTITIKNKCSNINFPKAYMFNIEVGACNQYISITTSQTPTSSNPLQNLIVRPGVNMSSTTKTISHDTLGDTTLTTYKPANSVEISV